VKRNRFIGQLTGVSMFKIILKSTLIFSLPVFSLSINAAQSKEIIANQCNELSKVVISLTANQNRTVCIDKLYMSALQVRAAASLIMGDLPDSAKIFLNNAIAHLQHAELSSCNHYIQISHSKLEAHNIKALLQ
jgi:hypothetical protein